jgi:Na+/H+ antiporter NhaD/arsenite permease-like protein
MFKKILRWASSNLVIVAVTLALIVSMTFIPPSRAYFGYIHYKVVGVLFSLMLVCDYFEHVGLLGKIGNIFIHRLHAARFVTLAMVILSYAGSMLLTNNVAILAFVPLAIKLFQGHSDERLLPTVIVLICIAANLGSIWTPFGKSENLYMFHYYGLTAASYLRMIAPWGLLTLAVVVAACFTLPGLDVCFHIFQQPLTTVKLTVWYGILFLFCVLSVFDLVPWQAALAAVVISTLIFDRGLFRTAEYNLIATYVLFFLFIGNIEQIPQVSVFLQHLLSFDPFLITVLVCQCLSNVTGGILLPSFSGDAQALLAGVNFGSIGTPIASLSILIGVRLYVRAAGNQGRKAFWKYYFLYNGVILAVLCLTYEAVHWMSRLIM